MYKHTPIIFAIIIFLSAPFAHAQTGNLFVSPQRVNMTEKKKTDQLHLVNKSDKVKSYEISMKNYAMGENGSLGKEIDEMPYSARDMIRFSPRRVTLQPGADQYVRLMLRKPKSLEPGGYHAHIEFTEIENVESRKKDGEDDIVDSQVKFEVGASYGIAIPIFINIGKTESSLSLGDVTTDIKSGSSEGELTVGLVRTGNSSVQKRLNVHYLAANGEEHIATTPTNVSVYRERDQINRTLTLRLPEGVTFSSGKLRLVLTELGQTDNQQKLDEKTVSIQ